MKALLALAPLFFLAGCITEKVSDEPKTYGHIMTQKEAKKKTPPKEPETTTTTTTTVVN